MMAGRARSSTRTRPRSRSKRLAPRLDRVAAYRRRRERPPQWVDEDGDGPGVRREISLESYNRVGELAVLQARLPDHDDGVVGFIIA